jgi:DNA topoisomerase-1
MAKGTAVKKTGGVKLNAAVRKKRGPAGASARTKASAAPKKGGVAASKKGGDGAAPVARNGGRNLVIVESPSKAKTLMKFLGRGYTVMASNGHIMDLPTSKLGVDIENDFEPEYVTIRGKLKILKDLKARSKDADTIYMAPDPDREGEAIAWHLARYLKGNGTTIRRLTFNEITERAVKEAMNHPRDIDENLVNAQQARRVLDRLVGYKVSPLLWTILRYGLSAGRVQSVALRILCEREKEVRAFVPVEYWTIDALLANDGGSEFTARLQKIGDEKIDLTTGEAAASIVEALRARPFQVDTVKKQQRRKQPSPPFITSTLQQEAFKKLRYSSQKTMVLAQQLYEGIDLGEGPMGLITYMRTDSTRIAGEAIDAVRGLVRERYGDNYLPEAPRLFPSKKGAQDAHEAIRPTDVTYSPDRLQKHLSPELHRLYVMIWNRFVASQMTPAVYETTSVDIVALAGKGEVSGGAPPVGDAWFRASGTVPVFDGFTRLWTSSEDEDQEPKLPALSDGEKLLARDILPGQHFTEPPPRYTEATLVKALEENGIGRPSTYATIVSTIINRDYVVRDRGKLTPTELGMTVTDLLVKTFPDIFNVDFTARMEDELDKIEVGEDEWHKVIKDFWDPFSSDLLKAENQKDDLKKGVQEVTDFDCPKCAAKMIKKYGRNGVFLACPNYPECKTTRPFEQSEIEETDEVCEKCGSKMAVKRGRYGRFLACSQYPDCKNAKPFKIGVPCPEPNCPGSLVEKRSKRGKIFYGCDQYPKCNFATWDRPVQVECPQCGNPFMSQKESKTKGQFLKCPKCKAEVVAAESAE